MKSGPIDGCRRALAARVAEGAEPGRPSENTRRFFSVRSFSHSPIRRRRRCVCARRGIEDSRAERGCSHRQGSASVVPSPARRPRVSGGQKRCVRAARRLESRQHPRADKHEAHLSRPPTTKSAPTFKNNLLGQTSVKTCQVLNAGTQLQPGREQGLSPMHQGGAHRSREVIPLLGSREKRPMRKQERKRVGVVWWHAARRDGR